MSNRNVNACVKTPEKPKLIQIAIIVKEEFTGAINDRKLVYQLTTLKDCLIELIPEKNSLSNNGCDEEAVLHPEAVIIRDRVLRTLKLQKEYFFTEETTMHAQRGLLTLCCTNFLAGWQARNILKKALT